MLRHFQTNNLPQTTGSLVFFACFSLQLFGEEPRLLFHSRSDQDGSFSCETNTQKISIMDSMWGPELILVYGYLRRVPEGTRWLAVNMSRTFHEECSFLEQVSNCSFRIKKGFVPNMKVSTRWWRLQVVFDRYSPDLWGGPIPYCVIHFYSENKPGLVTMGVLWPWSLICKKFVHFQSCNKMVATLPS